MSITVTHSKSGATAEVYPFGATVTSFITGNAPVGSNNNSNSNSSRQILFLSKDAKLDGTKAIRGGIPLVFPQFGQPDKNMPQHGFLRSNLWTVHEDSAFDNDEGAGISMSINLAQVKNDRGDKGTKWGEGTDLECNVIMALKIDAGSLTQTLTIQNSYTANTQDQKPFHFQTLFHTYYLVNDHQALDKDQCNVTGLQGYLCSDKITGEEYTVPVGADPVCIDRNVDHVYTPPPGKNMVDISIKTGGGTTAHLKAFAVLDGKEVPTSCVVWNPHKEKAEAMGDFNNDGYHDMICCEPGLLHGVPELAGGKECVFTQIISV